MISNAKEKQICEIKKQVLHFDLFMIKGQLFCGTNTTAILYCFKRIMIILILLICSWLIIWCKIKKYVIKL
ncbi:hypothetical protein DC487_08840 [Sphingobacterium corticibacter]|uniref:Transmembrane protein n=1 Tax=Sphingobacterium corticibacter TaxID=2171749 RepID=A0A2T8HHX2_9SPHI|nr:hypothetical protein DC487_08840 [Sphingobacterium corticibacter]